MSAQSIQPAFTTYQDIDGQPLEGGMIYIGTAGLAAATNQITVYWDAALTQAATQPIRTTGGFPVNNGAPSMIYTGADDFSIAINDKNNSSIISALNKTEFLSSTSINYTSALTGGVQRTLSSKLSDVVSVKDFGAVGDGVSDDTTAIQAALDAASAALKVVYFPAGQYKITSGLSALSCRGIYMEGNGYGSGDNGIYPSGSGYTALTIEGSPKVLAITIGGTGNAVNGIYMKGCFLSNMQDIRVYNLDGFGVRIDAMFDTVINSISVELCGNLSSTLLDGRSEENYAFGIFDGGDTSNMTHILRLQVEQALQRAIYVSPNTLSCLIENIHSERAYADVTATTWYLGGSRGQYNCARLTEHPSTTVGTLAISGSQTSYNSVFVENSTITTEVEGVLSESITIINPEILGLLKAKSGQGGRINILGGKISSFTFGDNFRVNGTVIGTLTGGFCASRDSTFDSCSVNTIVSGDATAGTTLINCVVSTHGSLFDNLTTLRDCTINNDGASTLTVVSGNTLRIYNSIILPNINLSNGSILSFNTAFLGTITQTAGSCSSAFDSGSSAVGTTGISVPAAGTWVKGDRSKNLGPAVGQPKAWVCTVAGSPGTWVSEGNL
jgi:hypothetical protein